MKGANSKIDSESFRLQLRYLTNQRVVPCREVESLLERTSLGIIQGFVVSLNSRRS